MEVFVLHILKLNIIAAVVMGYKNFMREQEARPKIEGKVEKKS